MSQTHSLLLGCFVAVVSSLIQSLGITLQRRSHIIAVPAADAHVHHRRKRNLWFLGFMLFIVANIFGALIQITTLPLIVLSPLQSIGLIFNSALACLLLPGEKFTAKLGFGTLVIAVGAFVIAYNGNATPAPPETGSADERFALVLQRLTKPHFLAWFIGTFFIIVLLLGVNMAATLQRNRLKKVRERRHSRSVLRAINRLQFIKGVSYGLISGTLTAHTFLFAKSLIDVVVETILNDAHGLRSLFSSKNLTPYLLLAIMLAIIGCQLTAFNLGLSHVCTSILYPLCFLVYNLVNLVNDLAFNSLLSDHRMTIGQLIWVILGLSCVLCGVVIISWDSSTSSYTLHVNVGSEDEYILNAKFPYTDADMQTSQPIELHANMYSNENSLNPAKLRNLPANDRPHRRVFSYEQTQLLGQVDY